jgi:hypothetical protein
VSRLRIGYTRATHLHIIERQIIPVCSPSETRLTLDHFLWECQGTKTARQTGLAGLAKLTEYTKKIGIFHEI